jgi:putative Holliday junction resolvase
MRILALDFGTKRIGVALSDELLLTAQGMDSIRSSDRAGDLKAVKDIVEANGVTEIIVGLPLNMDGTKSAKTRETELFIDALSREVGVPVKAWDERLTSMQAERTLLEADVSRRKRRSVSDRLAAQLILQNYLDYRRAQNPRKENG